LSAGEAPEERIEAAREILGGRAIIGADPGRSRHDAMTLAELGADYMAFGPEGEGDVEARDELAAWWAEIFEIPCVVLGVATSAEAVAL
ncbi:thiamine phosphate synthase, partial [Clostridium sp. ZBS13]|uniref:thiamine phosphate synthase n=1 Tax=Clostridium sp. ZBS13 TaxID=2949971 RepID=UPI00207B048F